MTDFSSIFWDYYITIIGVVSIVACAVFLKSQSKRRIVVTPGAEPDTTHHVWDGDLREYQNPMPRWWIWLFYLTIAFSLVYLILFPGLGSHYKGTLNWTSTSQYADEIQQAEAKYGPMMNAYLAQPLSQVAADPRARVMGERIFVNNCAQCHGSDARGARGFPNLADSDWLYGGSADTIKASIAEGRQGVMPALGSAIGDQKAVMDVAHYVLSLSGSVHDPIRAARGKDKYVVCAGCHGIDGRGNTQLGAPNLTDKVWLYGGTAEAIADTISKGRQGVMPGWKDILSPAEIHLISAYVLSLSPRSAMAEAPASVTPTQR